MDLQPQTSFIPKKPLAPSSAARASFSILRIIGIFLFCVSILAAVLVFIYGQYLKNRIASAQSSLAKAQAAYDPTAISDLIRLDSRIRQAQALLDRHVAPSTIFTFLENNTLSTVRFNKFDYEMNPDGSVTLKLTGNSLDFASVALQSDQFSAAVHTLRNIVFSDINIDPVTGIVGFGVSADVNPSTILYSSMLSGASDTSEAASSTSGQ